MNINRYVTVQAILSKDKEIIPIWDSRIVFEKSELYGNGIRIPDSHGTYYNLIDVIYDLKTKQLSTGIILDLYPDKDKSEFKEGDAVLYEKSHRVLLPAVIKEIVFKEYSSIIKKGKKIEGYYIKQFSNQNIVADQLYEIRTWKPFYLLDNGLVIEWDHQIYKQYNGEANS